jgi:TetR/AcrR family transcriptional repressor of nem operon
MPKVLERPQKSDRRMDKRERLISSARKLFHQEGYNQTSIADIADDSGVPVGNVYYYYKTKADIATAVLEERKQSFEKWYEELEKIPYPQDRLITMLSDISQYKHLVVKYGCPVGSLCQELTKGEGGQPISKMADGLLKMQIKWATKQFREMGKKRPNELGLEWISSIHGTSLVANAMNDPKIIDDGIKRLKAWVKSL